MTFAHTLQRAGRQYRLPTGCKHHAPTLTGRIRGRLTPPAWRSTPPREVPIKILVKWRERNREPTSASVVGTHEGVLVDTLDDQSRRTPKGTRILGRRLFQMCRLARRGRRGAQRRRRRGQPWAAEERRCTAGGRRPQDPRPVRRPACASSPPPFLTHPSCFLVWMGAPCR